MIITIDGPSGVGKSTLAKGLARCLGLTLVDTGATYRAVALLAIEKGVDIHDSDACGELARNAIITMDSDSDGNLKITLNGRDITDDIRNEEISAAASEVSKHTPVRQALVAVQRQFASNRNVVIEGRDTGSVVFPNADLKIFLEAPLDERAERRKDENAKKGDDIPIEVVKENMAKRDTNDMTREDSPLIRPPDSISIYNGGLEKEDTLRMALEIIEKKLGLKSIF